MEIFKGTEIIDLALHLRKQNILIIGDIHVGFEEALNKEGLLIPRFQFKEIIKRLELILQKTKFKKIIINGDLKHEFGKISDTEWRYTLRLVDFLEKYGEIILIRGNHDKILGPLGRKTNLKVKEYYYSDGIYICHGHVIPKDSFFRKAESVIIGHEHPAVSLREKGRTEKYKCYLKGKFMGKNLVVMPSFNLVTEGTDILSERLLSPFLKNIDDFEVYVIDNEVMYFGRVRDLLKISQA